MWILPRLRSVRAASQAMLAAGTGGRLIYNASKAAFAPGEGAAGTVYAGVHRRSGTPVAIKGLHERLAGDRCDRRRVSVALAPKPRSM